MLWRLFGLALAITLAACSTATTAAPAKPATSPTALLSTGPATPATVWVNASLGLNLRRDAGTGSPKIEVLAQGASAPVLDQRTLPDGSIWYHVRTLDGQEGWLSGAYVVSSPIYRFGNDGEGWSLMLPQAYTTQAGSASTAGVTQVRDPLSAATPFLEVRTAPSAEALPSPAPSQAVLDHAALIEVWSYTVLEKIYRLTDGRYLTVVRVPAPSRAYQFTFWTQDRDSPLVAQVLASVTLA